MTGFSLESVMGQNQGISFEKTGAATIKTAYDEAIGLNSGYITPDLLFLGLFAPEPDNLARVVLTRLGIQKESARERVMFFLGNEPSTTALFIGLNHEATSVMVTADRIRRVNSLPLTPDGLVSPTVGSAHILLALAGPRRGNLIAFNSFEQLTSEAVRHRLRQILGVNKPTSAVRLDPASNAIARNILGQVFGR